MAHYHFRRGESSLSTRRHDPVIAGPGDLILRLALQFRHRCVLASDVVNAQFPRDYLILPLNAVENFEALAKVIAGLSEVLSGEPQRIFESRQDTIPLVFLTRALHGGGAERVLYDIVHALADDRVNITVIPMFESAHTPVFTKGLVVDSFEAVSRRRMVPQMVQQMPQEPIAAPLPASIVALAGRLTPEQLRYIKSSRLFRPSVFVLRKLASVYRAVRYGTRQNRVAIRPPPPDLEHAPVGATDTPPEPSVQADSCDRTAAWPIT